MFQLNQIIGVSSLTAGEKKPLQIGSSSSEETRISLDSSTLSHLISRKREQREQKEKNTQRDNVNTGTHFTRYLSA